MRRFVQSDGFEQYAEYNYPTRCEKPVFRNQLPQLLVSRFSTSYRTLLPTFAFPRTP